MDETTSLQGRGGGGSADLSNSGTSRVGRTEGRGSVHQHCSLVYKATSHKDTSYEF